LVLEHGQTFEQAWVSAMGFDHWKFGDLYLIWNTPHAGEPPKFNGGTKRVALNEILWGVNGVRHQRRLGHELFAIPSLYSGLEFCIFCLRLFSASDQGNNRTTKQTTNMFSNV
jgi:hypothetical protein